MPFLSDQKNWRAPRPPGGTQCLHIVMAIGKCTSVFGRIFWLEAGVEKRGICWGIFPSRNLSWGKKISMKGAQDLLALLKKKKNNEKINMNKFFFSWK